MQSVAVTARDPVRSPRRNDASAAARDPVRSPHRTGDPAPRQPATDHRPHRQREVARGLRARQGTRAGHEASRPVRARLLVRAALGAVARHAEQEPLGRSAAPRFALRAIDRRHAECPLPSRRSLSHSGAQVRRPLSRRQAIISRDDERRAHLPSAALTAAEREALAWMDAHPGGDGVPTRFSVLARARREGYSHRATEALAAQVVNDVLCFDTPRERAILVLARVDCAAAGRSWVALPWRLTGGPAGGCRAWWILAAAARVDELIDRGLFTRPPDAAQELVALLDADDGVAEGGEAS